MLTAAERLSELFPEVQPLDYYRQLFPERLMESEGEQIEGLYTGIAISVWEDEEGKAHAKRRQITKGLPQMQSLIDSEVFTMTAPVLFAGRRATNKQARYLTALEFDLDFLRIKDGKLFGLEAFLQQTSLTMQDHFDRLPTPTYVIASSDRNLHVVYLLDEPLPLYKFTLDSVRNFRRAFIPKLWDSWITESHKKPQFESSPVQAFRLVGSKTKRKDGKVRCFATGARVSVEEMNRYSENKILVNESSLSLEKAKELYPDWYEKRITQGLSKRSWQAHEGLYKWWFMQMPRIEVGHRFHYLVCLSAYAQKCGISDEQLREDAAFLRAELDKISPPDNPLTKADLQKALQAYKEEFRTLPRAKIAQLCGIDIPKAKRNGRPQAVHVKIMSATRDVLYPNREWANKNGRPSKAEEVKECILDNPQASIAKIAKESGASRPTVYKYLLELLEDPQNRERLAKFVHLLGKDGKE